MVTPFFGVVEVVLDVLVECDEFDSCGGVGIFWGGVHGNLCIVQVAILGFRFR